MSIALCFGLVRSLAGQTLTHRLQPVQSSGATWIVKNLPLYSLPLNSVDLKVGGAPASAPSSYTFARIAACGHTSAHWLHWMQIFESHTGISSAMFRFSHFAVAGRPGAVDRKRAHRQQVALAGQHHRRDLLDEVGRLLRHQRRTRARGAHRRGHRNLVQVRERLIDHLAVAPHDLGPALAVGLLDRLLDVPDGFVAGQHAGDREEAGLHDRVDARAHAGPLRQVVGVDREKAESSCR